MIKDYFLPNMRRLRETGTERIWVKEAPLPVIKELGAGGLYEKGCTRQQALGARYQKASMEIWNL